MGVRAVRRRGAARGCVHPGDARQQAGARRARQRCQGRAQHLGRGEKKIEIVILTAI